MGSVISVHSFRGGTGKSNLTANLSSTLAARGYRVGVFDTDIASPGIHVLFGINESSIDLSLNGFLWGKCSIEEAAVDVLPGLEGSAVPVSSSGALYLVPASIDTGEIARVLHEGYDVGLLNDGILGLMKHYGLDFVFVDTHPGVNEETLLSIAISDVTIIVLRPDQQDFQGTAVTIELARQLECKNLMLLINKAHRDADKAVLKRTVEQKLGAPVVDVIALSDDMVQFGSGGVYCMRFPDHAYSKTISRVADEIEAAVGAQPLTQRTAS